MLGSVAAALSDFAALSYLSRKRERENACILSPRLPERWPEVQGSERDPVPDTTPGEK